MPTRSGGNAPFLKIVQGPEHVALLEEAAGCAVAPRGAVGAQVEHQRAVAPRGEVGGDRKDVVARPLRPLAVHEEHHRSVGRRSNVPTFQHEFVAAGVEPHFLECQAEVAGVALMGIPLRRRRAPGDEEGDQQVAHDQDDEHNTDADPRAEPEPGPAG